MSEGNTAEAGFDHINLGMSIRNSSRLSRRQGHKPFLVFGIEGSAELEL